ncbi:uncharacterized protein STEHIDRAFT_158057 [Stereum hirsutum FP-91666 SS1]|uniref:uncharacterized protein n=1 Tax=Stereum hirsutum (strain FP-91666) TaxID=721885 RepID=UPI000444A59B|nr:uncharacterized protein STEHIDRAFT_158057 [Stereum hirsutum FP-91666 SS1]EIM85421.1 hypothetical protein STEHIDRAFT_158057 [Stereum hirsutum FP-91666 SS1]
MPPPVRTLATSSSGSSSSDARSTLPIVEIAVATPGASLTRASSPLGSSPPSSWPPSSPPLSGTPSASELSRPKSPPIPSPTPSTLPAAPFLRSREIERRLHLSSPPPPSSTSSVALASSSNVPSRRRAKEFNPFDAIDPSASRKFHTRIHIFAHVQADGKSSFLNFQSTPPTASPSATTNADLRAPRRPHRPQGLRSGRDDNHTMGKFRPQVYL